MATTSNYIATPSSSGTAKGMSVAGASYIRQAIENYKKSIKANAEKIKVTTATLRNSRQGMYAPNDFVHLENEIISNINTYLVYLDKYTTVLNNLEKQYKQQDANNFSMYGIKL